MPSSVKLCVNSVRLRVIYFMESRGVKRSFAELDYFAENSMTTTGKHTNRSEMLVSAFFLKI